MQRRILQFLLAMAAIGALCLACASALINRAAEGRTYSNVGTIPHRRVGLLLGCAKTLPGGWSNPYFTNRIQAAVQLYRAGKVDCLLVSGDNHIHAYDEAKDMKDSLAEQGVPRERIYCDYAGFRTLDSVVRAREIFGQTEITIISQEFHNRRAIFIARHHGMDAIGFNALDIDPYHSFKTQCREQAAKVSAVCDVYLLRRRPRFSGPKIRIGSVPQKEPI